MPRRHVRTAVTLAVLLTALAGCGDRTARQVAAMNRSNLQRVTNLYEAFQNYHGGRGPKDEAEFKSFIRAFDKTKLAMMKVNADDLNSLFVSERDGQPLQVRYQVGGGRGAVVAVVFEQAGKDGKKQVGFTGNKVEEVDDARYAELRSGKGGPAGGDGGKGGRPAGAPSGAPTGPAGR